MTSNEIDTDYHQMNDDDNDEEELGSNVDMYTGGNKDGSEKEQKSGHGYHLPRVAGISVLTFIVTLIALFVNDLSSFSQSLKRTTTDNTNGDETITGCKVKGVCGYAKGEYKYKSKGEDGPSDGCPATASENAKYTVNYSKECDDDYNGACRAMNAGNAFVVFGIFALLFGLILMIIIVPMCFQKRCFPLSCIKYLRYILAVLFAIVAIANLLSGVIWMASNCCDNADQNYGKAFDYQSDNTPGISTILMLLCFVANLVGFGAVCCCWMDHKQDREDFWTKKDDPDRDDDDYRL